MESILGLAKTEGMLFKYGSGTGSNLSPIRSSKELLAGGGTASGPVSFMKGFDAFAGVIKSGGKTRRAAKMVILNADHPDILEFIRCKAEEERKAWALIDARLHAESSRNMYSEHGLLALIRSVFGQVCQSFTVVSNCMPGSPHAQVASAIIFTTSRALSVSTGSPEVRARVCHSPSSSTACMNSSVTRTELLEFWKKIDE